MIRKWINLSCQSYRHIRAGSDIAFLGGVIRYILENERYFHEYVKRYTNAPVLIHDPTCGCRQCSGRSAAPGPQGP